MTDVKKKTILLVDDDAIIALLEKQQLENEDYNVVTASNGEEAISLMNASGGTIDLILMDIDLGDGMDGTSAAEEILKSHEIPVVFLSAHTEKEIVRKTENITSYGYVVKNSGIIVLDASIRMAFRLFEARINEKNRERELYIKSLLLDQVMDQVTITDLQGNITYVNRAISSALGHAADEVAGKSTDVYGEDPVQGATQKEILEKTLKDGAWRGEVVNYSRDGTEIVIDCRTQLICDSEGKPVALGGIGTNITDRKRIELELKKINERYRLIVDNISEGVVLTDMNMKVLFVTPSVVHRHGFTLEELNAIPLEKRLSPESYEKFMKAASEELTTEKLGDPANDLFRVLELEFYRKDGSSCWTESTFRLIRDSDGKPAGVLGVGRDISERKQAEDAVKLSDARFRSLSEDIPACICSFLPDSTILYANSNLASMRGLEPSQLTGKRFLDLLEPGLRGKVREALASLNPGNPTESHVQAHDLPDGSRRFIEWKNRAFFNKAGFPERFLAVGTDITERWLSERNVEKLLREKELILKEVHHRIKNNMNVVFSLLTLQAGMQDNNSASDTLLDAAGRIQTMMMLYDRLYRSDIGSNVLHVREYLPDLINSIIEIFPRRGSVIINTEIEDITLGADILSSLGIIISEFVTNSMKYAFSSRDDGVIAVKLFKKDNCVSLLFMDNGPGIPEDISFESSTGFGLQLVDMLVKQIGGLVCIERGAGTQFRIEFNP